MRPDSVGKAAGVELLTQYATGLTAGKQAPAGRFGLL
jgi:hypothetical protein